MTITNTDEHEYKTRFTFHLHYFNGTSAEELSMLNFFANPKEYANPDVAVENSTQIVDVFKQIAVQFQKYMRGITEDWVYKNHNSEGVFRGTQSPDAKYIFKLVDHNASVRENGALTDNKEVRVIYEYTIDATTFYPANPLSILPIWKDNDGGKGIRTLIKDLLTLNKYTNRFKRVFKTPNHFSAFSI